MQWAMRLEMESKLWKDMCFVTLTYNDDNLPYTCLDPHIFFNDEEVEEKGLDLIYYPTLRSDDLPAYVKRVRKSTGKRIRYFGVGEYGTKRGRPHLHILFFGLSLSDLEAITKSWYYGFVQVTPFFYGNTCVYVAGYVQKKLYGKDKDMFKLPEFMRCSHHLGEEWFFNEVKQGHIDLEQPYINWHGYKYGIPRTFRKKLQEQGLIKVSSLDLLAESQKVEYWQLVKDLQSKGTSLDVFFRQRRINALHKENKLLRSRKERSNTNYEIS